MKTTKENLFAMLLCITLILPLAPVWAQDSGDSWTDLVDWGDTSDTKTTSETEAPKPATETTTPKTAPETPAPKATTETTAPKAADPKTAEPKAAPKTGGQSVKLPKIDGPRVATGLFSKVVSAISQIGAIFGKSTGTRIGGTSVSAIAMLVIAKLIQDRGPDWLRWLLYLSGGTMVAGSGANITKLIMGFLS